MNTTVCNSKGGIGCVRGFVREKCRRCHLGSVACEMCHSSRTHNAHHHSGRLSLHHTLWFSSTSLPAPKSTPLSTPSSPTTLRLPYDAPLATGSDILPVSSWNRSTAQPTAQPTASNSTKVAAVSYKEPLPVGHHPNQPHAAVSAASTAISRHPSLSVKTHSATQHTLVKPFSKSEPSSPTFSSRPITPTSCGFCTGGRKACDECFGLSYVQRVCQSCLRDQHRRHARKPSLPASMHQLGTKIKERFSHHSSSSTALNSVVSLQRRSTSTSASESTCSSRSSTSDQGIKQLQQQQQNQQNQNSTSTVTLPTRPTAMSTNSFTKLQPNSPTLGLVDEASRRQEAGELEKGAKRALRQHRMSSTPCDTDEKQNSNCISRGRSSFKKAVLDVFRLPSCLLRRCSSCGTDGHSSHSSHNRKRPCHRRQWPLSSGAEAMNNSQSKRHDTKEVHSYCTQASIIDGDFNEQAEKTANESMSKIVNTKDQRKKSVIIGRLWRNESSDEKLKWKVLALYERHLQPQPPKQSPISSGVVQRAPVRLLSQL